MSDFNNAYEEIEKLIKSNPQLLPKVKAIGLSGSTAKDEQSLGWSDLDVLIVFKKDNTGNLDKEILDELKAISKEISKKYSFTISVLPHTINDLKNYVSFEYLIHYSYAICTYPNSKVLKRLIDQILSKRRVSTYTRKRFCIYYLRHTRFNLLRKYVSMNRYNTKDPIRDFGKILIDKMIKVADLTLNYRGIWPESKSEMISLLAIKEPEIDVKLLKEALGIRKMWKDVTRKRLEEFIPRGFGFVENVMRVMLRKYKRSTPEESISL